ncbi:hypothetical protein A2Y83_03870 [Candidatus Falkowbacteria bacterium RBG_13_39_14]|uniref:Xylose isomerase-like TIM barrel domain-containing protein n=1 Tax=Candidatus Falkowbacteria bacterium RBG_13_39_14 TaxID=1797985 RepID=A0A1F5S7U3_9BACT|nr:MAG: hypothetical protein A2Y83_03870 [Candidatus Falkowbacteria bacterium RBG_13_39_14]
MENLESKFNPEFEERERLFKKIEVLKEKFPDIGIVLNGMRPIEKKIEVCNMAEPSAMQFRPKNAEEMRKLAMEIKEGSQNTCIHLDDPKFDEETGKMVGEKKTQIMEIIKEMGNSDNFKLANIHLGWRDAEAILDEEGKWRNTDLANNISGELADLFAAGIKAKRIMAIENTGYADKTREILSAKPEHLLSAKQKIAEVISAKEKMPLEEALSKIGYTFDLGHMIKNGHLLEKNSIEDWFRKHRL